MSHTERYCELLAAHVRGNPAVSLPRELVDKSFDVVTLLEVLEHIPEVDKAVQAAVKMARKFVVVSAPSQPDDNPEHIHLLTKEKLTALFRAAGCDRLSFDGVNGHHIMIATLGRKE